MQASCSYTLAACPASRHSLPWPPASRLPGTARRAERRAVRALALHLDTAALLPALADHAVLAYERVVLPCHNMGCGDAVYRSTLDPVLRMEQKGINPQGLALLGLILLYLTATPGVLAGAIDYYILDKWQRLRNPKAYTKENLKMGKKLATGGFGTVYKAELFEDDDLVEQENPRPVIVKKAKEFGEAEVWMNERLMRAAEPYFAEFLTAFEDEDTKTNEPLWLIWQYEGDFTLASLMQRKDFPYTLEPTLFGCSLDLQRGPRRSYFTIRLVMLQVLEALRACHSTGIVHRDIKPQNLILSERDARIKLIDLGAAADLRVGINYVPSEFLLDPRYAPPQQYIMSTQTPRAPPVPVAATLSPILWRLNNPDRFDMFSVGVLVLQMVFPPLRSDNNLIAFRRRLESLGHDIKAWRRYQERRGNRDFQDGFQLLDLEGGAMWDLVQQLMVYKPSKRLTAAAALRHRAFGQGVVGKAASVLSGIGDAADRAFGDTWVADAMMKGEEAGGLTEAQLNDEIRPQELPAGLRRASTTINWWSARQNAFRRAMLEKQAKMQRAIGGEVEQAGKSVSRTISKSRRSFNKIDVRLPWGRQTQ